MLMIVAALMACTGTTEPARVVTIVTASQTVVLQSSAQGPTLKTSVTVTNNSAHPIYWSFCDLRLQRNVDLVPLGANGETGWQVAWVPDCPAINVVAPSSIGPGESAIVPINVLATPGLYRVNFLLTTLIDGKSSRLPDDVSSSDPFTVVAQ